MKKNMGTTDRALRFSAAAILGGLIITGMAGWKFAGLMAAVLATTSLAGVCPLYRPLDLSTVGNKMHSE